MLFNNESAVLNEEYTSEISQYELGATGGLMHAYEIECAFNEMMESIGLDELNYYVEAVNAGTPYKTADFSKDPKGNQGILDKISAFVRMIIQKVQELFNRAIAAIGKLQADQFVNKYGARIKDLVSGKSNKEFKPFKMTLKINIENWANADAVYYGSKEIEKATGMTIDPDSLRGHYVGKASCSAKEFPAAYKAKLYGKGTTVKDIDAKAVEGAYTIVKDYKKMIAEINKKRNKTISAFKKTSEQFKKKIAGLQKKDDSTASLKSNEFSILKDTYSINMQVLSMDLRLCYDYMQSAKAICLKALAEAKDTKKEAKKEAAVEGPEVTKESTESVAELFAQVEIL